jgi:alpha-ketoglutarate-dependent taurine dioxygenase
VARESSGLNAAEGQNYPACLSGGLQGELIRIIIKYQAAARLSGSVLTGHSKTIKLLIMPQEILDFPTLIEPHRSDGIRALSDCLDLKAHLQQKLLKSGALLFRDFPVMSASHFADFARQFSGLKLHNYVGGASPRQRLADGVYTSTEYPQHLHLSLHNEMSYTHRWPTQLFFTCVEAPTEGGETPIADSRVLLRRIPNDIVKEFSRKRVKYLRRLPSFTNDGYSWQESFETDDRRVVEKYCEQGNVSFEWQTDGTLLLTETRPATTTHPLTGEEVWFNQADSFQSRGNPKSRLDAWFGDDSEISDRSLVQIRAAINRVSVLIKWQLGDVLVLDNLLTAHGRCPFSGPRKILLAMT